MTLRFSLTDAGNGERYASEHGADVRYCFALKTGFVWNGKLWAPDEGDALLALRAEQTAKNIGIEAHTRLTGDELQAQARWATRSHSHAALKHMVERGCNRLAITQAQFNRDPMLFNCANGTIDLRTGALREHRREDFITKQSPVTYDPDAKCPKWNAHLERVLPDPAMRQYFQRAMGYSATGLISEQCLFMHHGVTGTNGKTVSIEAARRVFGEYARNVEVKTFHESRPQGGAPRSDIVRLADTRFLTTSEAERGKVWSGGRIKQLTGGDQVTERGVYVRTETEFRPQFKIHLLTNHLPRFDESSDALDRRLRVIPWSVKIPENEKKKFDDFVDELSEEGSGILAWLVQGCLMWQQTGLGTPVPVQEATAKYRVEQDVIGMFITELCHVDPRDSVPFAVLYERYTEWCNDRNEKPDDYRAFGDDLKNRGYAADKAGKGIAVRRGLSLLPRQEKEKDRATEGLTTGQWGGK